MKKGYTLIETVIYISLFSLLITSGFISILGILKGVESLNTKIVMQREGSFVLRKIGWALEGMDKNSPPLIGGTGCLQTLTVFKTNTINPVRLRLNTISGKNYIEIQEDGSNYFPVTTDNVTVNCLKFSNLVGTPIGITGTSTINNLEFTLTKYVRI